MKCIKPGRCPMRWFATGFVTYTRTDSSTLTVPFCNVLNLVGDQIKEYLIFIDNSQLFTV